MAITMLEVIDGLGAVRRLIESDYDWSAAEYPGKARTADGRIVDTMHPSAARYGLTGALVRVGGSSAGSRAPNDWAARKSELYIAMTRAVSSAMADRYGRLDWTLYDWSARKGRTAAEILEVIDSAIARLRADRLDARGAWIGADSS